MKRPKFPQSVKAAERSVMPWPHPVLRLRTAVLFLFLLSGTLLYAQNTVPFTPEEAREYKTRIKPASENTNDPAGGEYYVILYGQKLSPPYTLNIDKDALYLNGVQVDPPMVPPWEPRVIPPITPEIQRTSDLNIRIRAEYDRLKATATALEEIQTGLINYLEANEGMVMEAEWTTAEKIHLVLDNGKEHSLMFRPMPTEAELALARVEILKGLKTQYTATLAEQSMLVIGYGVVLTVASEKVRALQGNLEKATVIGSEKALLEALQDRELTREYQFINFK